ncbi:Fc.00g102930.m01.CDS01 [Cosmosporella sp. VM-42]
MSGVEVVGLVLGGFPILLNCLEYYRHGFEPLEEWWNFKTQFVKFVDDVKHQMMLYDQNLKRLLDPIVTDNETFNDLTADPSDPRWRDGSLASPLERRLSSELDRFLRIIDRMNKVMEDLRRLLQVEDGKATLSYILNPNDILTPILTSILTSVLTLKQISWVGTPQQKPWQWHYKRLQISFSKGKHKKVKKLDSCNKELEEILGYGEHIIAISNRRKSSKPVSHLETIRQHACRLYNTLKLQWKCDEAAHTHKAHLSLHVEAAPVRLSVIFPIGSSGGTATSSPRLQAILVQSREVSGLSSAHSNLTLSPKVNPKPGPNTMPNTNPNTGPSLNLNVGLQYDVLSAAQETVINTKTQKKKSSLVSRLTKKLQRVSSPPPKSVKFRGEVPMIAVTPSDIDPTPNIILQTCNRPTATSPTTISELCSFLGNDRSSLATIQDEFDRAFDLSKEAKAVEEATLLAFPELLRRHHQQMVEISRQCRFEMAAYIATALLHAHLSPWLSSKWSKRDLHFLADTNQFPLCNSHPFVSRNFVSIPRDDENDVWASGTREENEEATRACLFAVGVMILELIFGRNIEDCSFRAEYYGKDNQPNDQTDVSTARRWAKKVLGESGPQIADAVRRCLDCSFGPRPNFADVRFREAVYEGVIKPLAAYSGTWEEEVP